MTRESHAALAREAIRRGRQIRFKIDAPILGYRASVRGAFDPKYRAYKDRVRMVATAAGVPILLPEYPSRARLCYVVRWTGRARIDKTNVEKAVEDALFRRDRRILEGEYMTLEGCAEESIEVSFEIIGGTK